MCDMEFDHTSRLARKLEEGLLPADLSNTPNYLSQLVY